MKQYNSLIFYYSVFVVTVLLIGSVFFFPRPFNLIQPIALAPMFLFFWLRITDPARATEASWSMRLLMVLVALSALGLLGYYLASQEIETEVKDVNTAETQSASVSAEIAQLRAELEEIRDKAEDDTLNEASESASERSGELLDLLNSLDTTDVLEQSDENSETDEPKVIHGYVQVQGSEAIDVYEEEDTDSRIVGVALPQVKMPFYQSAGSWYEVEYEEGLVGFVKANQVTEVSSSL